MKPIWLNYMKLIGKITLAVETHANRTCKELNYHYNNVLGYKQLYMLSKYTTLLN